jgi:hypothetical protein
MINHMWTKMRINFKHVFTFMLGAITAAGVMASLPDKARLPGQSYATYKALLDDMPVLLDKGDAQATKGVIERAFLAHMARDTDASIAELSTDYSWNKVGAEGAVKMANGLDKTYQLAKQMYEGPFFDNYLGLESTPIAVIDNLGIQYEVEQFRNEDDSVYVLRNLVIYEIKDDKLWRLWSFSPSVSQDEDSEEWCANKYLQVSGVGPNAC